MAFVILCDHCGKIIKPGNSSYSSVSCTMNEKQGVPVRRELPPEYVFFTGDGVQNHFREAY